VSYLDESTLSAIEADLEAAHESLAHGDKGKFNLGGLGRVGFKVLKVGGAAAAFSYANARSATGELLIAGKVPVDLASGIALALLSLSGWISDDLSEHALDIALGAGAAYAARTGAAFGAAAGPWKPAATATAGVGHMAGQASMPEISGRRGHVPAGTQRFAVRRVA
jgi:hypothetical protein